MTDFPLMDKPGRLTAVVSADLPGPACPRDFAIAVREGTERRLAEMFGPVDFSVVAAVA